MKLGYRVQKGLQLPVQYECTRNCDCDTFGNSLKMQQPINHLFIDEEDQGEGDGPPQPAVHHDELVDHLELVQAVLVGDEDEQEDAEDPEDGARR